MSADLKNSEIIKIGTRESELAMKQSYIVRDKLNEIYPELKFEIISMKTKGDKILDVSLSKIGSKSLFTKELEIALENKEVDIVVHSLKDLPTTLPEGMVIGTILEREDPRDCVIMHPDYSKYTLKTLPKDSVIGTSSVRRTAQLKKKYPHLIYECIRGNLNTRLSKLDRGDKYSGIILAVAGVERMGWDERITQYLDQDQCMYAVGQGALAVECREEDKGSIKLLSELNHISTMLAAAAERAFMLTLEGGCSAPVAVNTQLDDDTMTLKGGVWSLDGSEELRSSLEATLDNSKPEKIPRSDWIFCGISSPDDHRYSMYKAYHLGIKVAKDLLNQGAKRILDQAKAENNNSVVNAPPVKKCVTDKLMNDSNINNSNKNGHSVAEEVITIN